MKASEIIKNMTPGARALLAAIPGFPAKVGAVPNCKIGGALDEELRGAGVTGQRGGLTIKGAAVVDRIKAESEPF